MVQEVHVYPARSPAALRRRRPAEQHRVDTVAVPMDQETLLKLDLLAESDVDDWHILEGFGPGAPALCSSYGIGNLGPNDVYVDHSGAQPAFLRRLCHVHQLTCPLNRKHDNHGLVSKPQQHR